jgi:predicted RNA binding protein YcfA (HicA-like mRNA interferase family)
MPSDVRYSEVARMLAAKGYQLERVRGSHFQFTKAGIGTFTVPVHHGKVKYGYVRKIEKLPA